MTEPLMLSSEETDFLLRAKEKGWVLVPADPTPEIGQAIYAAWDAFGENAVMGPDEAIAIYRAAVTAAPPLGRPMDDE